MAKRIKKTKAEEKTRRKALPTGWETTDEDEIERRRRRAEVEPIEVRPLEKGIPVFGTFSAETGNSGRHHRIEIRSLTERDNTCDCLDFQVNGLGTCKHVESVLRYIKREQPEHYTRVSGSGSPRVEVFLDRRGKNRVAVKWPDYYPPRVKRLVSPFFASDGVLLADPVEAVPSLKRTLASFPPKDLRWVRIASDVDDWVGDLIRQRAKEDGRKAFLKDVKAGKRTCNPVRLDLYQYQQEGMLHLAFGERALLADDMGLGKTVQAIAACELLRQLRGIERVLVICPVSLKTEWEEQIRKFTGLSVHIVMGSKPSRIKQYRSPAFFTLVNYEQVRNDVTELVTELAPDVVILDEAQRIKNWQTLTARAVKQVHSPYAFVLTGTPLENRIDEIYSIVQFLDPHLLGPLFRFNREYYRLDDKGRPAGYQNLDRLHRNLRKIMLRRRKDEVEDELPGRTVNNYYVTMHREQLDRYTEFEVKVSRLVAMAKRRPLTSEEMDRLQRYLACMRMLCDTPYILDETCRICPKLPELASVLEDLFSPNGSKALVFSEWERMLQLVRELLDKSGIGYAWHTGSVPQKKRRLEINRFKDDPECRVFLSTDSGSTGLNLQVANIVVNMDLPWNPAKLEQRIARAWRKHQKRPVTVVNMVSEASIEQRMLGTLAAKQQLADGVLDGRGELTEMDMPSGRVAFMERLEQVMGVRLPKATGRKGETTQDVKPAAAEDPFVVFRQDLLARLSGRLLLLERRRQADGGWVLIAVVDGDARDVGPLAQRLIREAFPKPRASPGLEVLDRHTYETLQRLAGSGLISMESGADEALHASPGFGGSVDAEEAERRQRDAQQRRLSEARQMLAGVDRKLKMSSVLADNGFPIEALPAMVEALEASLRAALHTVEGQAVKADFLVPVEIIDTHLQPADLVPAKTSVTIRVLRDLVGNGGVPDESDVRDLLSQASLVVEQVGEVLCAEHGLAARSASHTLTQSTPRRRAAPLTR